MYNFSDMFQKSRYKAGVSQEFMADALHVTRKTINNWETGVSSPTLLQSTEWFDALGVNPMPYYLAYLLNQNAEKQSVEDELIGCVKCMTKEAQEQLLFLCKGDHGSSPASVLQMINANLQTPMRNRINIAGIIIDNYEVTKERNGLTCPNAIQPDLELLVKAYKHGKEAVLKGNNGYSVVKIEND